MLAALSLKEERLSETLRPFLIMPNARCITSDCFLPWRCVASIEVPVMRRAVVWDESLAVLQSGCDLLWFTIEYVVFSVLSKLVLQSMEVLDDATGERW